MEGQYSRILSLVKFLSLRKVVFGALFLFIVVLAVLYTMSRNTTLKSSEKWRSHKSAASRLHSSRKRIMLLNGTALGEDWLLAAVDKLPFKAMTPSSLLLEDLYFTPNYNIQEDYSDGALLEPKESCPPSPELIILVPSEPKSFSLRRTIRETWGSVGRGKKTWPWRVFNMHICLIFVVGVEGKGLKTDEINFIQEREDRTIIQKEKSKKITELPVEWVNSKVAPDKFIYYDEKQKRDVLHIHTTRRFTPSLFQSKKKFIIHPSTRENYQASKNNFKVKNNNRKINQFMGKRIRRSRGASNVRIARVNNRKMQQNNIKSILQESERFNDILQFDTVDSYRNLTRKLMLGLQWATKHIQGIKYIMKADQDVFVNIPLVATFLRKYGEENSIYGNIYANSWVERTGRWAVPESAVPIPKYPIYAAGNAYIISVDAIELVLNMSAHFPYVTVEDAFITGILPSVCGVNRINVAGFTRWTESQPDPCDFVNDRRYVGNNYTEHSFRITWRDLIDRGSGRCEE
ncbi:uncharacterized protein LOC101848664 [Aplysia californica]|uniref:Uncharacterized protein LOC101848664 n=1 Tax=Aplysia californica TaxID=6500 RepID=A0ABM0JTU4_APLCA|nr:uncharacterized protein LOC101848664 [Aplysia californica]